MSSDEEEVREVVITAPRDINITRRLVDYRLAACGHHTAVRSIYTWNGAIEDNSRLVLPSTPEPAVSPPSSPSSNQQHPYDVPCVIALPITDANPPTGIGFSPPPTQEGRQPMQTYDHHGNLLIVLDRADLDRVANFWCPALGYDRPHPQSGPYLQLVAEARGGVELLLQQVPETKSDKNRLHLDLRTSDLNAEVARLIQLGATLVADEPSLSTTGSGTYAPTPTATNSASCDRLTTFRGPE